MPREVEMQMTADDLRQFAAQLGSLQRQMEVLADAVDAAGETVHVGHVESFRGALRRIVAFQDRARGRISSLTSK